MSKGPIESPENLEVWCTYKFKLVSSGAAMEGAFVEARSAGRGKPLLIEIEDESGGRLAHEWRNTRDWKKVKQRNVS